MRVTEQQVFGFLVNSYQRARSHALRLQEHLATGKQGLQPSDDPGRFHRIVGEHITLTRLEQRLRNISTATTRVELADTSLQGTTATLSRIRQLAVQYASDTNGAAERTAGAHEVRALLQHLLQLGNAEFDENQPVFGGTSRHGFAAGLVVSTPITLTNTVADIGADCALVVTPYYFKGGMTSDRLRYHYTKIADEAKIPVLLYNVPQFTGVNIAPDLVAELSTHPNIVKRLRALQELS